MTKLTLIVAGFCSGFMVCYGLIVHKLFLISAVSGTMLGTAMLGVGTTGLLAALVYVFLK